MSTRTPTMILTAMLAACDGIGGGSGTAIDPPDDDPGVGTETVDYPLADFAGVSVGGSFDVDIRQGAEFAVELRVDSSVVDQLDVGVEADRLNIGFVPDVDVRADTLEATVRMPALETISLRGSNAAALSGFAGATLEVMLDGNDLLEARDCRFDYLVASATGSSLLEFQNTAALPAAHVELAGSSSATLNLMDSATVTGSLSGSSTLLYYGSNADLQISTAGSATITRMGETR